MNNRNGKHPTVVTLGLSFHLVLCFNFLPLIEASTVPFTTQTPHRGSILSIAFCPDGTKFISGSTDNSIRIWSFPGNRLQATLHGHSGAIRALGYSPDGQLIASGSADNTIGIWNGLTLLHELNGHSGTVTSLAFSHDGKYLVSASQDSTIRLWSMNTFRQELVYRGHTDAVSSVALSPDNKYFVSGSYDNTIRFWTFSSPVSTMSIEGHTDKVLSVTISPDGTCIASTSCDNTVKLWHTSNGMFIKKFRTGLQVAYCSSFSPDGRYLVTGDDLGDLKIFNLANPADYILPYVHHRAALTSIAISPDGTSIISGGIDSTILIWKMPVSPLVDSIVQYPSSILSVASTSAGTDTSLLAVTDGGSVITIWSLATGAITKCIPNKGKCNAVSFSRRGTVLAAGCDNSIKLYHQNRTTVPVLLEHPHSRPVHSIVFSSSDTMVASECGTNTILIHSVKTGKRIARLKKSLSAEVVTSLAFPPDNDEYLFSGTSHGTVRIWSLTSRSPVRTIEEGTRTAPVSAISFSPNGTLYATGTAGGFLQIRSGSDHSVIDEQRILSVSITSVCFTPDNSRIIVGSSSGDLVSLSVKPLKKTAFIKSDGAITALCAPGDGRYPVIAGDDKRRLQWWEPRDSTFFLTSYILADSEYITFNRDGYFTASGPVCNDLSRFLSMPDGDSAIPPDTILDRYYRPSAIDSTLGVYLHGTTKGPIPRSGPEGNLYYHVNSPRGNKYAIIIGIADYANLPKFSPGTTQLTDLKYSDNDAAAFKKFIEDTGRSGHDWKIFYLVNEQATKTTMDAVLTPVLQNARSGDLVVIFFSGHGRSHPEKADDVYLLSYDVTPSDYRAGFAYDDLLDLIINCKADHVISYIDACKSGLIGIKGTEESTGFDLDRLFDRIGQLPENKIIFTSSKGTQVSWEDDEFRMGTFSYFLMKGLNGCASEGTSNNDNFVNLGELEEYVTENVRDRTRDKSLQTPEIREVTGNIDYSLPLANRTGIPVICDPIKAKKR